MNLSKSTALFSALLVAFLMLQACSSDDGQSKSAANEEEGMAQEGGMQDSGMERAKAQEENLAQTVSELIKHAGNAANEGRHAEAKAMYRRALDFDPSNVEASRGYKAMVGVLSGATQEEPFDLAVARTQERQAKAQFYFHRGLEARSEDRLGEAVDDLDRAYQLLKFSQSPLAIDLNADVVKRALDDTREQKDRKDRMRNQTEAEELARRARLEEDRERKELDRQLKALWGALLDTFEREQYKRAENIAAKILELDWKDTNAQRLQEAARRARHAMARGETMANTTHEWDRAFMEIQEAMLPPATDIGFPNARTWKRIADRGPIQIARQAVAEETEADRTVRERMANTILPKVDWNGKVLSEVVAELQSQTNVNIVVSAEATTAAEDVGELDVEFTQFTAADALANVCSKLEITYTIERGMVRVQTKEESRKNKVIEFYDVRDLVSPIRSFPGVQINLNASGVGDDTEEEDADDEPNMAIEMDRLVEIIKAAVDPAWDEDDGNRLDPRAGTLIVRQTPAKQRLVRKLLNDLRKNTGIQVAIESRFITVENNFLQDIGIDLRGLGDDTGGVGVPGPGRNNIFDDFGQANVGFGTNLNQNVGFGTPSNPVGIGTGNDSGVFFSDREGNYDVRARTENLFDEVLGDPRTLDNSGGVSFQFAYLDDVQLEAILRAVQKYERINTVTAPKLMVYNTQRAHLMVLNEVAYVKDFDVEIAQAAVIADPIIDKVREGVVLDVRPIVSHDRRYVTLELRPTVATLVRPIRTFTTQLANGSAVTLQLPELRKQAINTTVVVPDGGTLLLGGMKFAEEKTLDSGVPILKDVPILGYFFSRQGKSSNMKDLIILLKVKIVILSELEPTGDSVRDLLSNN